MFTVYMHKFPNGKVYIGITKRKPEYRWGENGKRYANRFMKNAIQKYGWDNIEHIILAENLTKAEACNMETDFIAKYKSNQREYGYNIASGGEINSGYILSDEAKKQISERNMGHPCAQETREKIRQKKLNYKFTDEHCKHISESHMGMSPWNKGKHFSDESRQKMSESAKNRKMSEEAKDKIRQYQKGRKKGPMSEETKRKISEAVKKQWSEHKTWYYMTKEV